ncbi:MAG: TonB-dependent receptor [Gemmatimonadetes bacterium]|nr:TonB-dependent receptor [Gemmatimonadota bacterium]
MNSFATALGRVAAVVAVSLALVAAPVSAQNGTVTGSVTDATSNAGLQSVQVYLVGTGLGTLTNASGRFLILNVPAGSYTIRAERLGYGTQEMQIEVAAGGTVQQNFSLDSEALGLDEIVVTGTAGAARRREIGNTIGQVDVANVVEPPQSVDDLLQGRVSGMTVTPTSGNAGGGAKIRLRGNVSVAQSNQPIIYVDGVRIRSDAFHKNVPPTGYPGRSGNDVASPLNNINPADIERIEVIKGAAATTLYGTEAAAGVIQIFTKRGHRGAAQWTASVEQGFQNMRPFGVDPALRPSFEDAESSAGGTADYMFINPWLKNAWQQRYSLSVGGGGEDLQYFVSGSWEDDEGVLPNDLQKTATIRGNFTFSPAENLQIQWNTSFTNDEFFNTAAGNNAHGLTLNVYRREANYFGNEDKENLDLLLNQEIVTQIDHLITGGTATYTPFSNFTNRLSVGYDLANQENRNLRPFGFVRAPDGILADGRSEFETVTVDYVGTYSFGLTDNINSSLSFGGQSVTSEILQTVAYGEDFPGPGAPTVTTAGTTLGFETRERVVNAGFFVQDVFDISDKYFLTAGFRIDGNSAFGQDFGLQFYPKLSASWVVSDEDFWSGASQLKLRAAWGQSGRAPGAFDAVQTYDGVGWGGAPAFYPRVLGNALLGPERTAEWEFGFDGSFLADRLSLEATYYNQKTTDALFNVRQTPSSGFIDINGGNSQLENVGEIKNSGIEFTVNAAVLQGDDWAWDLGASVSTNSSEVGLPAEVPEFSVGGNGWIIDGESVPVIRGEKVMNPDAIADPIIEDDQIYGPNLPTRIVGLFTTVSLPKGLRLSARGEYQGGHYVTAAVANSAVSRSVIWAGCYEAYAIAGAAPITPAAPNYNQLTALQRARCDSGETDSNFWAEKADFFKIRQLALQAPIPESWIPGATGASVTVSGSNIFRWTNDEWTHFDPEMGTNSDNNPISRDGVSTGDFLVTSISEHIPAPATWTLAFRVVF